MRKLLVWLVVLWVAACTPKTVISPTYDFNQVNRIGIMAFENTQALAGVENLFAKYLIAAGFKVVERAQLESILREHHIAVSGYLAPETTREIGRILGVDLLLVGEVSTYSPARTETHLTTSHKTQSRPVTRQEVMQLPDGSYASYMRTVGTETTHSYEQTPVSHTINAEVGIIAKLVDVETAEIVWIGSTDDNSAHALTAADRIAKKLVKSFTKELTKMQEEK